MTDSVPSIEPYPTSHRYIKVLPSRINLTSGRPADQARTRVEVSEGFFDWLSAHACSIAISSYDTAQLILVGSSADGKVVISTSIFEKAMGLAYDGASLWLCTKMGIRRLANVLTPGESKHGFDRLFIPRVEYVTGNLDAHELALSSDGEPIFVNTLYSCVCRLHDYHSFSIQWQPPFIRTATAEDTCHLNGLALADGTLRYVTAFAAVDAPSSWRNMPVDSGLIIDVQTGQEYTNLSKPHSPRQHRNSIWVIDSGRGFLVRICPTTGDRENIALLPGFARGLSFIGNYALVTTSLPRNEIFRDMEIEHNLKRESLTPICALLIIDLRDGRIVEKVSFHGRVRELFDVCLLHGTRNPLVVHPSSPKFSDFITSEDHRQEVMPNEAQDREINP